MAITMSPLKLKLIKFKVGTGERLKLYNKIASFMEEGIDLKSILINLRDQYLKLDKNDARGLMLNEWNESIGIGRSLSSTMSEWVPPSETMIIKSGEEAGNIASAFRNAAIITEASKKMVSTLASQLAYPIFLLVMLFGIIYLFSVKIIPQLTEVIKPEDWPDVSYNLYLMSVFVETKWWVVILSIIGTSWLTIWSFSKLTGRFRHYLDKIPPYSIYKTFQSSAFLVSVSAMLKTGIPIVEAINETRNLSSPYVREHLDKIFDNLENGKAIGLAINSGFLERETGMDIEIYSELRGLDQSMEKIGMSAIDNSISSISAAAAIIKNILMISVAAYIGWVYYAFNTLTQSITSNLNGVV